MPKIAVEFLQIVTTSVSETTSRTIGESSFDLLSLFTV